VEQIPPKTLAGFALRHGLTPEERGKQKMDIGIIGLGRMGGNIARRLMRGGHKCVVFDRSQDAVKEVAAAGAAAASDAADMLAKLTSPRAVWLMLPAGGITEKVLSEVAGLMRSGDILIDGGNSFYKDDIRRAKTLREKGIHYVDVGTSGGVWGLERGYCLMIGGDEAIVTHLDPIFACLAPGIGKIERTPGRERRDRRAEHGYIHCGPPGLGHFVKMIHNGIEYGLMQAYGEGFDILRNKASTELPEDERFTLDMADIAEVWRRGSVISSWLLDLCAIALTRDGELKSFTGSVADSGEGRWTVEAAIEEAVPVDVLSTALYTRFRSRRDHTFAEKLLSAMRYEFGGHVEQKK
jgi:6-phosphogluconate dehydrogenase